LNFLQMAALSVAVVISACATPGMLPQTQKEIDYNAVGYVKGSGWHDGAIFDFTEADVVEAVRSALLANGMQIHEFSKEERKFIAEIPWNAHRYVNYVAVYYRGLGDKKTEIHVVSLSTKDINVLADDSELPLPPKIVASVTSRLSRQAR